MLQTTALCLTDHQENLCLPQGRRFSFFFMHDCRKGEFAAVRRKLEPLMQKTSEDNLGGLLL